MSSSKKFNQLSSSKYFDISIFIEISKKNFFFFTFLFIVSKKKNLQVNMISFYLLLQTNLFLGGKTKKKDDALINRGRSLKKKLLNLYSTFIRIKTIIT